MTTAQTPPLTIGYVGNFEPEHSTENHVRAALERTGHHVVPLQENTSNGWEVLHSRVGADRFDLVLWTRTGWDWPAATGWTVEEAHQVQLDALAWCSDHGVPTVGFHLDRWWGLDREGQVAEEPFFRCDLVATADGGHPQQWLDAGVRHVWMPPGVLLSECERVPQVRREYAQDVVFVGSWQHYHAEWLPWRRALVDGLRRRYGRRFAAYPRGRAVRGQALSDLYNSAAVVVGDSCLAGGATHYWSDRIPETVGRGGFLLHPAVDGLADHYTDGEHLVTYRHGDLAQLYALVDRYLDLPGERDRIRLAGQAHVREHHTYERRMDQLLALCTQEGLLS